MPTYAYACKNCGHRFEVHQSFTDDALTVCPECEGTLRKVFSSVGVVFKGSGFYRTDSRSGGSTTSMVGAATEKRADKPSSTTSSDSNSSTSSASTSSASTAPVAKAS